MTTYDPAIWEAIRIARWSDLTAPPSWPTGVRPISMKGLGLLGIDERTGKLYWDGAEVATAVGLKKFERGLAIVAIMIAFGGFVLNLGSKVGWWG
jgi:hypothetical protein